MARSIAEIKKIMTDRLMRDDTLRTAYGITGDATWDNTFSPVSLENLLTYIVAVCAYTVEVLFDRHKKDVDEQISRNIVPTLRWYHAQALAFQYGDELVYDEATHSFKYLLADDTKRVIRYCAVQDAGNTLSVLVATDVDGKPGVVSEDILKAFKAYLNTIKIAGILLNIRSLPADKIRIRAKVYVSLMSMDSTGKRINDGSKPVEEAIERYLNNIVYGGTFNKTKCVDAIQQVEGVTDVELTGVEAMPDGGSYTAVTGNNYTAESGCFIAENLNTTIAYVTES